MWTRWYYPVYSGGISSKRRVQTLIRLYCQAYCSHKCAVSFICGKTLQNIFWKCCPTSEGLSGDTPRHGKWNYEQRERLSGPAPERGWCCSHIQTQSHHPPEGFCFIGRTFLWFSVLTHLLSAKWHRINFQSAMRWHCLPATTQQMEIQASHLAKCKRPENRNLICRK